jgi:hypothetical protein
VCVCSAGDITICASPGRNHLLPLLLRVLCPCDRLDFGTPPVESNSQSRSCLDDFSFSFAYFTLYPLLLVVVVVVSLPLFN